MKKIHQFPQEVIVSLNALHPIAQSNLSIDTETIITDEIDENNKLVKESIWDNEW